MENTGSDITNNELLKQLLGSIKDEGEQIRRELKKELKLENKKIIDKIDSCCRSINELEEKIKQLESRSKYFDKKLRKNNILVFGLQVAANADLVNVVLEKLKKLTGIEISINDINNLFTIPVGTKTAIKIEFVSYLKKNLILKSGYKLKGTNISFAQDLSFEDRQERRFLKKHQQIARSKNYFAKIRGQKLIVNNEIYSIEQLKKFDLEDDTNEIVSNTSSSPHYIKPNSAPATPSISQTYFEDSLDIFSLRTPQSAKENHCHSKKEDNIKNSEEKNKSQIETIKIDDKEKENIRNHRKEEDITKLTLEKNIKARKTLESTISKKPEHESKKKINLPKERSNSASSYNSRIITRQQTNNKQ